MLPPLDKAAWLARCVARYASRGGLAPAQAMISAEARYAEAAAIRASHPTAPEATPEDWADADMESWSDDQDDRSDPRDHD